MIAQKSGPRCERRPENLAYTPARSIPTRRPVCKLYRVPIVDRLPPACPFAAENPLDVVADLERDAYAQLSPGPAQDVAGGLDNIERAKVCMACVGRLSAHPRIKRLRAQASNAGQQSASAAPIPAVSVTVRRVQRRKAVSCG